MREFLGEQGEPSGGIMAGKGIENLSGLVVENAAVKKKPYKLADGAGLYVEVMPIGAKYSRWKFRFGGKEKRLALRYSGHGYADLFFMATIAVNSKRSVPPI